MNSNTLQSIINETFGEVTKLRETKGKDYASDEDTLSNFKEAAARLGVPETVIWAVYADKHWSAIMSFCRKGQVESEPIEGRIDDAITYLLLLKGLIADRTAGRNSVDDSTIGGIGSLKSGVAKIHHDDLREERDERRPTDDLRGERDQ